MEDEIAGFLSTDWSYENLEGTCGACGKCIVANRATDLGNAFPAVGKTFHCRECGAKLHIYGDTANSPIDQLLLQVFPLKLRRLYTQCIFALAQALEITMSLCVEEVLVEQPIANASADLAEAEELRSAFEKRMRNMTFDPLRNLITKLAIHGIRPASLAEAKRWVAEMNNLARDTAPAEAVSAITQLELRKCIEQLRSVSVGMLRNDVAHHLGRRPTQQEVEQHEADVKPLVRLLLKTHRLTSGGQLIVGPAAD